MKRVLVCLLSVVVMCTSLFAQGGSEQASDQRVVTTVCRASYANMEWYKNMNADFEKETGIHVDVQPTPGNDGDHEAKVNIDLLAGGNIDVIPSFGPKNFQDRVDSGYFEPLNNLLKEKGIDASGIWGKYIISDQNGMFYGLPVKQEMYCVFYNKDLFDRAGVEYPSGSWTWDEYVETARKLTDHENGIYGSFMSPQNPWYIFSAKQLNVSPYTPDGKSNWKDPAFADSIEWYASLGNELGVQMSEEEMMNENVSWNYWAMAGDHLAMYPQGNWFTRLLNSPGDYPRDWKYGVAPMPSAGPEGANNFVSMCYVSINKNAAHPDEALEYTIWLGENQWKYEHGIPAFENFTAEQQKEVFAPIADQSNGQITVDDLYKALIDTGLGVVYTDILGPAAAEINLMANSEIQAYALGTQSIAETIDNIDRKADEAIRNIQ